jgi:hypothetical protein
LSGNSQRRINMQIELNDEHLDLAFAKSLAETIEILSKNIKCLEEIKNPRPYIIEDIEENTKDLKALKRVYKYYTGEKYGN